MWWTPISEKLPQPYIPIIFYSKSNGVNHGIREGGNRKIEWFRVWGSRSRYKDVTHWMPLPDPPKE